MRDYAAITELNEARDLAENLLSSPDKVVGFDIETGYHGPPRKKGAVQLEAGAFVVGFSITNSVHWARYLPLRHDEGPNLDPKAVFDIFRPVLENLKIVAHNALFEGRFMRSEGIDLNIYSDSQIEAYAMGRYKEQGLKPLILWHFKRKMVELKDLYAEVMEKKVGQQSLRFNPLPPLDPRAVAYACDDSCECLALHLLNFDKIKDHPIYQLEMDVLPITWAMEEEGIETDFALLRSWDEKMAIFVEHKRAEVVAMLNEMAEGDYPDLNINSSQQLRQVLFEDIGLRTKWKTATGHMSTDEKALTPLAKHIPAVKGILEYRQATKMRGSYVGKWPKDFGLDREHGRVHPSWKQNGVPAGRYAVGDPGIQQSPKFVHFHAFGTSCEEVDDDVYECNAPHKVEFHFRNALTAALGYYLLDYDYGQIELRGLAGLSKEQGLWVPLDEGADIHTATAALMLGKNVEDVSKNDRAKGKTMNFALLYGMGVKALGDRLGISQTEAKELYEKYFEAFPNVHDWMQEMKWQGKARGYVTTYFGRRVPIFEFTEASRYSNPKKANAIRSHGERLSVNAPVQGSAADITKMAMVRSRQVLEDKGLWRDKVRLIINYHDELVFEVAEELDFDYMKELLLPAVEFQVDGWPKIVTDWQWGYRWGELQ